MRKYSMAVCPQVRSSRAFGTAADTQHWDINMRILFISRWFPYPPDNGSKIRVFNLIKALSGRHEIVLLSFAGEAVSPARLAALEPYCSCVHAVPYREFNPTRLRAVLGFLSTHPRSVLDTYSEEMQTLVGQVGADI